MKTRKRMLSLAMVVVMLCCTIPALATQTDLGAPTPPVVEAPTAAPTEEPTQAPTEEPTQAPTEEPTEAPTEEPTEAPTEEPTEAPTEEPTQAPTEEPTEAPTEAPTEEPTQAPEVTLPAADPSASATPAPTQAPTQPPTQAPTEEPTQAPTAEPTPTETPKSLPENVQAVVLSLAGMPAVQDLGKMNTQTRAEIYYLLSDCYEAFLLLTPEEQAMVENAYLFEQLFNELNKDVTTLEEDDPGFIVTIPASVTINPKTKKGEFVVKAETKNKVEGRNELDYQGITISITCCGAVSEEDNRIKHTGKMTSYGKEVKYTMTSNAEKSQNNHLGAEKVLLNKNQTSVTFTIQVEEKGIEELPAGEYTGTINFCVEKYQYIYNIRNPNPVITDF